MAPGVITVAATIAGAELRISTWSRLNVELLLSALGRFDESQEDLSWSRETQLHHAFRGEAALAPVARVEQ
jgi:hypothetical protein